MPVPGPTPESMPGSSGFPGLLRRLGCGVVGVLDWFFGAACLFVGLAVLAAIPVLNLLSLGYLLEASGRIARSGRLQDGVIGVRRAAPVGRAILMGWLYLLPWRFATSMHESAVLIDPAGETAGFWKGMQVVLFVVAGWGWVWAILRGARWRDFFWPAPLQFWRWMARPGRYHRLRDRFWEMFASFRLGHYFKLGACGAGATLVWLFLPVGLLVVAATLQPAAGALFSLAGLVLLAPVAGLLPFLQAHYAAEGRWRAMFEWREVRRLYRCAPLAFCFSLTGLLLLAVPLYLLKIELAPRELAWLPNLFFVALMFPGHVLCGWAMGRARRREGVPRHAFWRWTGRLAAVPVLGFYLFYIYLNQYLSWSGALGLFEQHAFLVPAPLLGY